MLFSRRFGASLRRCFRCCGLVLLAAVFVAMITDCASAEWPVYPTNRPHAITRGSGMYFSWLKLGCLWAVFLLWVKITDWVSQDTQSFKLPHALWNPVVFFPFIIALFAFGLTIPMFSIGFGMTLLAFAIPTLVYVIQRNQKLELHERVMTPSHIRHLLAMGLSRLGVKMASEGKKPWEKGPAITFTAAGANDQLAQANLISARQSRGFVTMKELLASGIEHRAERVMLDYGPDGVESKYQVDGVWHDAESRDRNDGDEILYALKKLADRNPEERRKKQQGAFHLQLDKKKYRCRVASQGTKTGERVLLGFAADKMPFETLEELGMRAKMVAQYKEIMLREKGMILISAIPTGGLTTTLAVSLNSTDRLLRDFIVLLEENETFPEIENVDPATYSKAKGETPEAILPGLARKQPDVFIAPSLTSTEMATQICAMASTDQLVFATINAKEAVEALLRVLLLKVPPKSFAKPIIAVLNTRLIRTLCEKCKEEYEPTPALLKKLGLPAGRVERLYRHPENPEGECPDCHGVGYLGRTAIFELLEVDDGVREALVKQPKLDVLRNLARKAGHRSLQEEGIAVVVRGVTSLPELMRVLKV
jgi:type II secretory ATPase GspE/PulE/Tfp pilus assembly ATPase PilB-like protein